MFFWADNGERIGTYEGHTGAIYSIDVNRQSTRLLSAAADKTVKLWDVESGKELYTWQHNHFIIRDVAFAVGDQRFMSVVDAAGTAQSSQEINIYKLTEDYRDLDKYKKPAQQIIIANSGLRDKVYKALWGYHNETILTAHHDGTVRVYSPEKGKHLETYQLHKGAVMSIQYDKYHTTLITASKDGYAKLIDTRTFKIVKEYSTGRPLNSASISPSMDHVIVGGGEQADSVTTQGSDITQFKVRFFHSIYCEELGSIMGHFGPVNCLTFSPDGRSFASGAEDGFVRVHFMEESYFGRTNEISLN